MIFRSKYPIGKIPGKSSRKSIGAQYQNKKKRQDWIFAIFKKLMIWGLGLGLAGGIVVALILIFVAKKLPSVDNISTYIPAETTKIYSVDKVILAELHQEENRVVIPLDRISPLITKTVVAVEDVNFYKHHGIDFRGILRAIVRDIMAGGFVEGASTLTQQLARNVFLHRNRTLSRKLAEVILAIQIERKFTKDEILEMYLNQVYWGHNTYGIQAASRHYFGKDAKDVSLAEAALLVGLLTGPELNSPRKNMPGAKRRQKLVLDRMADLNLITEKQAKQAFAQSLVIVEKPKFKYKAPYFTSYVIKQLLNMYGEDALYTSGMKVYTTLNYALQLHAEKIVKEAVEKGKEEKSELPSGFSQAAILAIDPRTGYILTMQGGEDYLINQFNRCTQAKRQPGSAFKPFVYLAALEKGFTPQSVILDAPITFNTPQGPYSPQNYNHEYLGNVTLRKALEESLNTVAIKLNYMLGPSSIISVAKQAGLEAKLQPYLSLPLGSFEVTMLDITSAYCTLANGGVFVAPTAIIKIEDREGSILHEHKVTESHRFSSETVYALVDMMKGVIKYGTGKSANLPRPVAGKTGTTSDYKDAWFIGFSPQLVCATWVGNDNNKPMHKVTGGSVPAKMWADYMVKALEKVVPIDFPKSSDLPFSKNASQEAPTSNEKYRIRDVGAPKQNDSKTDDAIIKFFEEE